MALPMRFLFRFLLIRRKKPTVIGTHLPQMVAGKWRAAGALTVSVRWQIVPRVLMDNLGHPDAETRGRVFAAMQSMVKIDHAAIEAAVAGER